MYREVLSRDEMDQYMKHRIIYAIRQSMATKRIEPPPVPDVLKERFDG